MCGQRLGMDESEDLNGILIRTEIHTTEPTIIWEFRVWSECVIEMKELSFGPVKEVNSWGEGWNDDLSKY